MPDPLTELFAHLARTRTVPDAWVAAHLRDGSIAEVWSRCDEPETLLLAAAHFLDAPALVRIVVALAQLAQRHAPQHARRWDGLLAISGAWADGRATRDEVLAARRASGLRAVAETDGTIAARYRTAVLASTFAASAVAEAPSLFGSPAALCASAIEVCLDAAEWALGEITPLMVDALVQLGGAFVPEADGAPDDRVREAVRVALAAQVRSVIPCPTLDQLRAPYAPR